MFLSTISIRYIVVFMILLSTIIPSPIPVNTDEVIQSYGVFTLQYLNYESSSGGDVYPGSSNAQLIVGLQYSGDVNASSIYGCIDPPEGFEASRPCSPAYSIDGDIIDEAEPGDIVELHYRINVLDNTTPGTYYALLNLTYRLNGNTSIVSQLFNLSLEVHSYPPLTLRIVTSYWSPQGYPGSSGVSLIVEVENTGESTLTYGDAYLYLEPQYFEPSNIHTTITGLASNTRTTITFNNIFISPDAPIGNHTFTLEINALMTTSDGVDYNASATLVFNATVEEPPPLDIEVVDHGVTSNTPYPGISYTRIYTTFRTLDQSLIETMYVEVELLNTFFENGSSKAYIVLNGPYTYGDTFTITTPKIMTRNNQSLLIYRLNIEALCSLNGVEYWNTTSYTLYIVLKEPEYRVYLIDEYWGSSRVYPGSSGETLYVELLNQMDSPITTLYAELSLPGEVFQPTNLVSGPYTLSDGSITRLSFTGIDVYPYAKPGVYIGNLILRGILDSNDGSFINITLKYHVALNISSPNITVVDIPYVQWTTGKAYSGMSDTGVRIILTPHIQLSIISGIAELVMPTGVSSITYGGNLVNTTISGPINYGEYYELVFNNLEIANNSAGLKPFALKLNLLVSLNGAEVWINETHVFHLWIKTPMLNLTILETGWTRRISSRYMDNAGVYVLFRSDSLDRVEKLYIKLLLPEGVYSGNGGDTVSIVVSNTIQYSEIRSITFNGLHVNTTRTSLSFKLEVYGVLGRGNALYHVSRTYMFSLVINESMHRIIPINTYSTINGELSPLLPNSRGVGLHITLLNMYSYNVRTLIGIVDTPDGINARSIVDRCSGLAGGSTCTLNYVLDVDRLPSEIYPLTLKLEYFIDIDGTLVMYRENYTLSITVVDLEDYKPVIDLASWHWGTTTPVHVYPGDSRAALTLVFINKGFYTATTPEIKLTPINDDITVMDNNIPCQSITPGSVCSATFYLDLRWASPGVKSFRVDMDYQLRIYGSLSIFHEEYYFEVLLEKPETMINDTSILFISSGWLNDWPVYPGENNTVYTVSMANLYPYPISSIYGELIVPEGFNGSTPYSLIDYVAGSIQSLQEYTLTFTLDVSDRVKPGVYTGLLRIQLYVSSDGGGFRTSYEFPVVLNISDPSRSVRVYQYGWIGPVPTPDQHGATYYVYMRDYEIPSMNGLLLRLRLPRGIYSVNNESILETTPSITLPSTAVSQAAAQTGIPVNTLLQMIGGGVSAPVNPSLSPGDVVGFTLKLNLYLERPGTYVASGELVFIDHWGGNYRLNISFPLKIYDKPLVFDVKAPDHVVVVNGTAVLDIVFSNPSDMPIYNVYTILAPISPVLVPVNNARYYRVLEPGEEVRVRYRLAYTGSSSVSFYAGFQTYTSTSVFTFAVIYRDPSGGVNMYNTTIPVIVKPFIDVVLSRDTSAVYRDGMISVNGIVINYGVEQARSVEAILLYDGRSASTFIGDIDPASQMAFRIDLPVERFVKPRAELLIVYRDNYNTTYTRVYSLNITVEVTSVTVTPPPSGGYDYRLLIIVFVAVFLSLAFYLIYRLAKLYARRLGGG